MQTKKDPLKPLSLYGLDRKEALHDMLPVDSSKQNLEMRKTPLEDWISGKIGLPSGSDLSREALGRYQLERLRTIIDYVVEKSPFYRERLGGAAGRDLRDLNDISSLPMTTADDLRRNGPLFLCVSQTEVERVVTLQGPGTDDAPRRVYFTADDLELTVDFFSRGMTTLVSPGQRVLILMPGKTPGSVGDLLQKGLSRAGIRGIVHGLVSDPAETIREIVDKNIDCLVGIPTQVLALARHNLAAQIPAGRISSVLLSADYVPSSLVRELRRAWGCRVFGHYGTTEMGLGGGVECEAFDGYHLREADLYFEIVDPDNGRPLPDGESGEIAFTTLTRRAMPLVRYRTGDLSRIRTEPCPCGTVLRRLAKVRGKVHEIVRLRSGDSLCISDLDEAVFSVPGIVDYVAVLSRASDIDRLELAVCPASHDDPPEMDGILVRLSEVPAIARAVAADCLVLEPIRITSETRVTTTAAKRAVVIKRVGEGASFK
ncbi:MAG: AMP-binding protein [Pseudomonadota bacterium]